MRRTTNPFYHYQDLWRSDNFIKWEQEQSEEFKKYRKLWQECPKRCEAPTFPLSINIEITDVCNAGKYCVMCPKHFLKPKNAYMPFDVIKKILDEARDGGCYAVNLNGAGESICHSDLVEVIRYAKQIGFLDVMFHSNGTLLDETISRQLIEAGLTRLIVSLDSHIPEIYKQIRPSFDFEVVFGNVKRFIDMRNEMDKREPLVRITMVVMKQNINTIQDTIDFWNFADYITINDCMYFDKFKVFEFDKYEISTRAKKEGIIYVCAPLYQQLSVTTDLKIISCSTIYAKNYRILGDYTKQNLKEIWESDVLRELRVYHEAGRCSAIMPCSQCDLPQIELLKQLRKTEGNVLVS